MPQPTSKHHAEWLSMLEISGPFLSMPVLTAAFPQGLDKLDDGQARSLRADFEFWQESQNNPAVHTAWIRLVLESLLGYSAEVLLTGQAIAAGWKADFPEHEETLRPDMMLVDAASDGKAPHLLIQVYPPSQGLEITVQGSRWQASAATRMMELCHATEVRLGLLTNGEQWMLVDAPRGETTGFITWTAGLWFDEPITLRAFRSLLGVQRFFGVGANETLESLLKASASDQQEITDQLGLQVRHAVEILIQMIDRADQDSGGELLAGIGNGQTQSVPALLYEAALTVMMRLVFMLSAEERRLLPLDDSLYAENYAASTLLSQLREMADQHSEDVLALRYDAWSRLLAAFRAVYSGIRHERLSLPAYGGSLFDPDKYPFLEGRTGRGEPSSPSAQSSKKEIPLPIDNRTVLHLLEALQMLQADGEARRISFRALDVEQIGHVYEGLLDHIAVRSTELTLGLRGAKRQEPEVTLVALEDAAKKKEADLLAWLKEETGRSESALRSALAPESLQKDPEIANRLRATIGNDARLFARLAPFAGLLRTDDFGFSVVIQPGSVYVTSGTTRRATGTHYTPRSLTEPVVQHTLEPLVYHGPAEGLPREQWRLRSPAELLALKICDMAMGSGGFLVQVVRYLAERLVEAWSLYGEDLADGDASGVHFQAANPATDIDISDPLILARRMVAERCIYGVDKNPLAVEIAKLSLWLVTLDKNKPFSFLDHSLKCGDSLVGCSEDDFLRWAHGYKAAAMTLFDEQIREQFNTAREKRRALENFLSDNTQAVAQKTAMLKDAEQAMAHIRRGADLLIGARLLGLKPQEIEGLQISLLFPYMQGMLDGEIDAAKHPDAAKALAAAKKERAFHWEFEFPEVFERGGFSAFVGNPPFIGGLRISTLFGDSYFRYLRDKYPSSNGAADLCAFFFLRAFEFLKNNGAYGFIATNTIAQGDTRVTGLDEIVQKGGIIFAATSTQSWPGAAAVYVSIIHIYRGNFIGSKVLNAKAVDHISSLLDDVLSLGNPNMLISNSGKSFIGSYVLGMGFVLEPSEAMHLLKNNNKNSDVLFPYLNGEDLNSRPDQSPRRWAINFFDWPIEKAMQYSECFERIEKLVKPERAKLIGRNSIGTKRGENWWRYGADASQLYKTVAGLSRVLVRTRVTKTHAFVFYTPNITFSDAVVVFSFEDYADYSILQSSFQEAWAWTHGSTLKTDLRYSPTDCFETYPFPFQKAGLELIGETYHETRRQIMHARQEGLTKTYNRFHDSSEHASDIQGLRELHVQMDTAVAAAYGWEDLALGHDFHETAQGMRYTISEPARREVLSRLLKLNHERWEAEQLQGAGDVKIKKGAKKVAPKNSSAQSGIDRRPRTVSEPVAQYGLQLDIPSTGEPEETPIVQLVETTPVSLIGKWDKCICTVCDKRLFGFDLEEHTRSVHQDKDPGYRKL